ncbi:MAG TPA: amidohydrolase family protein [Phycisphaerae bacterium]|nr:amidohydrolase family protein [Phycisphaerae bacterium]HOM49736.1 amidohydrolase family protein [Phycisphaerae bacterium]HPP25105.1 amidohydrolase family protein [Phycisphaerae bacterium]HPU24866.1 amidohydrolase family protein [Phycisphaerae bacterium]
MSSLILNARWILPVTGRPIENGCLRIADGRIASVQRAQPGQTCDVDYGDAVILPGLVNAHTHLDLTAFRGCVPYLGAFTDWIRILVSMQTAAGADERMDEGIRVGLDESLAAGVTCIADIGCGQRAATAWSNAPANIVGFLEVIGMGPRRFDTHPRSLRKSLETCDAARATAVGDRSTSATDSCVSPRVFIPTLSPHAPYSTAPEVYREAMAYCRRHGLPICTHLAETQEEAEFLAHGTGPFRTLLEHRGLWDGSFTPPGCSPVQYAASIGLLESQPLLAHVNYVSDEDIDLLARHCCSVAYCPRTHRFFRHPPHPYPRMLARGLNVCLGTDSLASAPSLSILEEMRLFREIDPAVGDSLLLEMGTLRGARALGLENVLGSLEPGKQADFVVFPLTAPAAEPMEDLLRGQSSPLAVYVGGRAVAGHS